MASVQTKKGGTEVPEDRQKILKQMKVRTKLKTDKSWIHQNSDDEKDDAPGPISPQLKALENRKSMLWSPPPDSKPESKSDRTSGVFTAKEVTASSPSPPSQSTNKQFLYSVNDANLSQSQSKTTFTSPPPPSATKGGRSSGVFTAKEVTTSSPSPPSQSTNKQFSYSVVDANLSQSQPKTTSTSPTPPSATKGGRPSSSYIIRGQPFNSVSQVKGPPSYNGYQKSAVQARTTSLPRVPTATGYKMSTEEYKKLAPYNVRNKSADLSDDETLYTPEEQTKRTEQASSILKNTTSRDRSYVISAAKRTSGTVTQDSPPSFTAKRVEIQEEDNGASKKSQTLPKSLTSYLAEDANKYENNWKDTQFKQTPPQTSPPRVEIQDEVSGTQKKSQTLPKSLTSYLAEDANRFENNWKETQSKQTPPQTSPPRVEIQEDASSASKKSQTLPKSLTSYLAEDANRFENNWKDTQSKQTPPQTTLPRTTERSASPKLTYSANTTVDGRSSPVIPEAGKITVVRDQSRPASNQPPVVKGNTTSAPATKTERVDVTENKANYLPNSLAAYLYDDASRFENNWKTSPEKQTLPPRASDRPESPKLTSSSADTKSASIKPEPGKITVLQTESNKPTQKTTESKSSTTKTITTTVESGNINTDFPKLTSYSDVKEDQSSVMQAGPGKITLLRDDSFKEPPKVTTQSSSTPKTAEMKVLSNKDIPGPDIPRLTSSSISKTITESPPSGMQVGPGKITLMRGDSSAGEKSIASKTPEKTTTTSHTTVTTSIDTKPYSTAPVPAPRTETKTKDTTSNVQRDLICWSDLDDSCENKPKFEKPEISPKPVPRSTNKVSEKATAEAPLVVISSEPDKNRITSVNKSITNTTETTPGNKGVTTTTETTSERPKTPEPATTMRPSPRSRDNVTYTEARYRVPEILEDSLPEPTPPRSTSHTTVTTTRSTDPVYTEYLGDHDSHTRRTVSSSREKTTTTTVETRYENGSNGESNQYDPNSSSNKGLLFLKEYVNTRESMKSPTTAGSFPEFSNNSEMLHSTNASYMYSSPPQRSGEGSCTYCGREIKDCAKIILDHLNIYCHEYCFKCGICNKPMGDLLDSLYIHRNVVHCENCYEKLF
ncbi:zinc finger protein 185 isoform X2 [Hyperolius riggenbachi]|uniref:zinc finger protein 185 isoform X2 n=1 Tax=Hyperolius riggenbachi TaxID=752182 RepID=UPI0035A37587